MGTGTPSRGDNEPVPPAQKFKDEYRVEVNKVLDAKGIACPMAIVKTKKAIEEINSGEVLEIHATDKGSKSDHTAWAKSGGHEERKETEEDGGVRCWT